MKRIITGIALSGLALSAAACGDSKGPLEGVEAILFVSRQARTDGVGDIFQYQSYVAGAQLMKLSPPTADGELTVICCDNLGDPAYDNVDIIAYDLNFAADRVVLSAKLSADTRYGLFILDLESGNIEQLATDPNFDYVYPTFLPDGAVLFATNAVVEEGAPQFQDEYERGTTLQLGRINADGTDMRLFARNLSHRITSSVASDGTVIFTQWDHLQDLNAGQLIRCNPDGTNCREAYGKEGTGVANSYYKAVEAAPGRLIAITSSRDMTFQSGAILDIRLGEVYEQDGEVRADRNMSEANASYRILTNSVPLGEEGSFPSVGRYYNAYPLNAKNFPDLLVSWADGPVQSDINGAAGVAPDFGIYLYNSERGTRQPIYDARGTWEINPRPLSPRDVPPIIAPAGTNGFSDQAVLIGSMNVYNTSVATLPAGEVYGVQLIEGFSVEEGIPDDFGLTEAEGAALLGVARVQADGSWAALIPANVPVHQQAIDRFGVALATEPVWISGAPGESRFCGGCHESRSDTTVIQPGITAAIALGPVDLMSDVGRFQRLSVDYTLNNAEGPQGTVGIPWAEALQPIFDAKCVGCHDGTAGAANPSYQLCNEDNECQTFTFDLRGQTVSYGFGTTMLSGYSASHLSLLGPDMAELEEAGFEVTGDIRVYVEPGNAAGSDLITVLNPPEQFPVANISRRRYPGATHEAEQGFTLTPAEHLLFIRMADMGGQFYSREVATGAY